MSFVSFLGWRPFWGDYWVIGLDEATWAGNFSVLADNGYQKEAFEMSPH